MIQRTNEGFYVIAGDSHIGKWVIENHGMPVEGDAARMEALKHIKPGDVVIDVGCNIGWHSYHYAKVVGDGGMVYGFDPNPDCIECAKLNVPRNAKFFEVACGACEAEAARLVVDTNIGASFLDKWDPTNTSFQKVRTTMLDHILSDLTRLDLIKIDAEGMELDVLKGAVQLIGKFRPVLILEINHGALQRRESSAQRIISLLRGWNYHWRTLPTGATMNDAQLDIVCTPGERMTYWTQKRRIP